VYHQPERRNRILQCRKCRRRRLHPRVCRMSNVRPHIHTFVSKFTEHLRLNNLLQTTILGSIAAWKQFYASVGTLTNEVEYAPRTYIPGTDILYLRIITTLICMQHIDPSLPLLASPSQITYLTFLVLPFPSFLAPAALLMSPALSHPSLLLSSTLHTYPPIPLISTSHLFFSISPLPNPTLHIYTPLAVEYVPAGHGAQMEGDDAPASAQKFRADPTCHFTELTS
jgi:hypothetical protein